MNNIDYLIFTQVTIMAKAKLPAYEKDKGHAHIKFGDDPRPILKKFGYCVVENVYTTDESNNVINEMWQWLEGLGTGIKKNDPKTWINKFWPKTLHGSMLQHTIAHEEFMWKIREHPNTVKVFSQIFGTNKLMTSFDGAAITRPSETRHINVKTLDDSWIHTDQDIIDDPDIGLDDVYESDYYSVQGIANFEVVEDFDSSLFVGEGSHLLHSKLFEHNGNKPFCNWYVLDQNDINWCKENNIKFVKVNAPKGSLILFDSRCFHQGFPHQPKGKLDRFRYVTYVAMTPHWRTSKHDINKKIEALRLGRATSHWSSNNIKIFRIPPTYGKWYPYLNREQNKPDYKNWSNSRKKLAGLLPYDKDDKNNQDNQDD